MRKFAKDHGIVLRKRKLRDNNQLLTIFSEHSGKIVLSAFGTKKITSRRLSHLETGNYIKFSYQKNNDFLNLSETELISALSKIKKSDIGLRALYTVCAVLDRILPEGVEEERVFNMTLRILSKISDDKSFKVAYLDDYLGRILIELGFIDEKTRKSVNFEPIMFIEKMTNRKIKLPEL